MSQPASSDNPFAAPRAPPGLSGAGASGPDAPATHIRWLVLALAVAMAVLLYLSRFAPSVATPAILAELGITKTQMGWAISAFFWTYALLQVPAGWAADRFGARAALALYVAAWSLAVAGMGLAPGLAVLILCRGLLGVAQAGAYPAAASMLRQWMPFPLRGLANSSVSMGGRCGGLLAMILTPLLMAAVGAGFGWSSGRWRLVFALYGLLGLGWAALFWFAFRNSPQEHPGCNDAERDLIREGRPAARTAIGAPPLREMLTSLNLWLMAGVNFFVNVGWIFLSSWLPTYLQEVRKIDPVQAGMWAALPLAAGMVGNLAGGGLTDWLVRRTGRVWGRRLPGVIACAGAALAYMVCLGRPPLAIELAAFAAVSCMSDVGIGAIWATLQDTGGRHTASALGFANMCGNVGAAACTALIGILAGADLWPAVYAMSALAFVLAGVCWLAIDPTRRLTQEEEPSAEDS